MRSCRQPLIAFATILLASGCAELLISDPEERVVRRYLDAAQSGDQTALSAVLGVDCAPWERAQCFRSIEVSHDLVGLLKGYTLDAQLREATVVTPSIAVTNGRDVRYTRSRWIVISDERRLLIQFVTRRDRPAIVGLGYVFDDPREPSSMTSWMERVAGVILIACAAFAIRRRYRS